MDKDRLAKTWIEVLSFPRGSEEYKQRMWAVVEVDLLISDSPRDCCDIVLEIASLSDDKWVLTNLGAGPLESLLADSPDTVLAWIEDEYPRNKNLRYAIMHVWQNRTPQDVWDRFLVLREKSDREFFGPKG